MKKEWNDVLFSQLGWQESELYVWIYVSFQCYKNKINNLHYTPMFRVIICYQDGATVATIVPLLSHTVKLREWGSRAVGQININGDGVKMWLQAPRGVQ